jgi:hypothetical protein
MTPFLTIGVSENDYNTLTFLQRPHISEYGSQFSYGLALVILGQVGIAHGRLNVPVS